MQRLMNTPLGRIAIVSEEGAITALNWVDAQEPLQDQGDAPELIAAEEQLNAYFKRGLRAFDLPVSVAGSDFQKAVCAEIAAIPFGETRQYGEIAKNLGMPAQSVGQACGGNPVPIIIPCHRVLSARGLGGFSARGGIETKVSLLRHEGAAGLLI
ncbi:methylated-DNA--[protein]-cysteine S-methyltransferase [Heliomarina baculiformis]|uniref:methylated-DNA--[protein]-cysteine S-methyltransferase n=1 Tax=Heliomarina baculiformis TaxID=2872036 RepID=UPI001EE38009|nr:methylated-DNA--[protein]-cysteine S-methyltransferase [Heliomarina baculiformis]